jgi:peptidoglycan/LPS O-acetylase OafA/YrhL
MTTPTLPNKPHYLILDGLRGVAAIIVVAFHVLEAHSTSHLDLMINHGYLAVDFFFLLSGFVIGYAYDDRWGKITLGEFFKRRLVRLQPMVIMGMLVGAAFFYFQDSVIFPNIHSVSVARLLLIMLIGFTVLPVPPSMDIRGWAEMHPLNGPAWSLFFEYVGNFFYAIGVRKLPNWALAILVAIAAAALIHLTTLGATGDVIGGWSLEPSQFYIGCVRLIFPFFAGLLLSRAARLTYIKNAFFWCSVLLIIVLSTPRIGDADHLWMNGLYESISIIVLFPLIVYLGASGDVKGKYAGRLCKFLGDISYPIYITHYPIIYTYFGWVYDHKYKLEDVWPVGLLAFASSIALSYLYLKLYDEPVRAWLTRKLLVKPANTN